MRRRRGGFARAGYDDPAATANPLRTGNALANGRTDPGDPERASDPATHAEADARCRATQATGATFREDVECLDADCNEARITQTVTWQTPRTKGLTFRVYGVTDCLVAPAHPEPDSANRAFSLATTGSPAPVFGNVT